MTKTHYPDAVHKLIEALDWRAQYFNQTPPTKALAEYPVDLSQLLLFESPGIDTWNKQDTFPGYRSMTDYLANAQPNSKTFPHRVMCLVTIGDSVRPHFTAFEHHQHTYDVRATAKTVLAYYEAREKLPSGFTDITISWLQQATINASHGGIGSNEAKKSQLAVALFYDAILSVSDLMEAPLLMQIFQHTGDQPNFSYDSNWPYVVGRATRLFCQTIASPSTTHYNESLARMFEWHARELLTWHFLRSIGYKYQIDPEKTTYRNLPPSTMLGALAHLPTPLALDPPGPDRLEEEN